MNLCDGSLVNPEVLCYQFLNFGSVVFLSRIIEHRHILADYSVDLTYDNLFLKVVDYES